MEEIKIGDIVGLNSGGPAMTVMSISGDACKCRWYNGEEELSESFPSICLRKQINNALTDIEEAIVRL